MSFKVGDRVRFSKEEFVVGTVKGVRRNGENIVVRWDGEDHDCSYFHGDIYHVESCLESDPQKVDTFKAGDRVRLQVSPQLDGDLYGTVTGSRRTIDGVIVAVKWDGASKIASYHCKDLRHVEPEASTLINSDIPLERPEDEVKVEFGTVGHDGEFTPLLKVGDKVKRPLGGTGVITEVDGGSRVGYPYRVLFDNGNWLWCEHDEVEQMLEKSKKVLNFWEARTAALAGKTVRMIGDSETCDASSFREHIEWPGAYIASDWEVIDNPTHLVRYIVTEPVGSWAGYTSLAASRVAQTKTSLTTIEIITDEFGTLISAKNV